ncbi:MAG: hypothetical protein ABJA20_02055 [Novosphingobium sp.]
MRTIIIALAASAALATPALANEARVEARGGIITVPGSTEGTVGVAAGYDFDLTQDIFAGVEVSADKILTGGTKVAYGFTGRVGTGLVGGKLFAAGGYTTEICNACDGRWDFGAGYEHNVWGKVYAKVEYRHYVKKGFTPSADAVVTGLGMKF